MDEQKREIIAQIDNIKSKAMGLPAILHHEIEVKNQILERLAELKRQIMAMGGGQDA